MFAEVAEALGEDFSPYLPACVERAVASLDLDDGVVYDSDEENQGNANADSEEDVDSDSEVVPGFAVFQGT